MNNPDTSRMKIVMIAAAVCFGFIVFALSSCETKVPAGFFRPAVHGIREGWEIKGPVLGLVTVLAYPFIAALSVGLFSWIRNWASLGQAEPYGRVDSMMIGAFWPVILIPSFIFYFLFGIVNRVFRD